MENSNLYVIQTSGAMGNKYFYNFNTLKFDSEYDFNRNEEKDDYITANLNDLQKVKNIMYKKHSYKHYSNTKLLAIEELMN